MARTPQSRRFTKAEHLRAVALVLAGCSKRGTSTLTGIHVSHLRDLLRSPHVADEIERTGGKAAFVRLHANIEDVALLQRRAAYGERGLAVPPD